MNVTSVSGINSNTLLRLIRETGIDMQRFDTVKHFVSCCGLSAAHHKSGKRSKWVKQAPCNKAGQIFKEVAQSLENSKYVAIGSFIRQLKYKRDSAVAYKAGGRKIAEAYYNVLTKGIAYVEYGIKQYEEQLKQKELALLRKLAKKHQVQVVEKQQATSDVISSLSKPKFFLLLKWPSSSLRQAQLTISVYKNFKQRHYQQIYHFLLSYK